MGDGPGRGDAAGWSRAAALLVALTALVAACQPAWLYPPPPAGRFGPDVDAVVVQPFTAAPTVTMNAVDLATFRDLLESELKARPALRAFVAPPTTLPNTATIATTVTQYQVLDQPGDGLFLRTIELGLTVRVRLGNEPEPSISIMPAVSYQKVYPANRTVAAPEFDFRNAARELAAQVTERLAPLEKTGIVWERALDASSGEDRSVFFLGRGIRFAVAGRDDDAERLWQLVLFSPNVPDRTREYRISDRILAWMRERQVDEETIDKLRPLQILGPQQLAPFRDLVRKQLGEGTVLEAQVLQMADTGADRLHLNLAAAHANLARLYLREKRGDLGTYHLSRAYAHYPRREWYEAWVKAQSERELIPPRANEDELFRLYLRIPAPGTVRMSATAYDHAVLPPPAFPEVRDIPPARPAQAGPARAAR